MIQVSNPNKFTGNITGFSGYNFTDACVKAEQWATRTNRELVAYYEQKAFGKSILVSYKEQANENWNTGTDCK